MGGLLTGGRLGAAEMWIKAISLKYCNLPLIGQLCGKSGAGLSHMAVPRQLKSQYESLGLV
jgi:hypothetical protein